METISLSKIKEVCTINAISELSNFSNNGVIIDLNYLDIASGNHVGSHHYEKNLNELIKHASTIIEAWDTRCIKSLIDRFPIHLPDWVQHHYYNIDYTNEWVLVKTC
jgi:hypothetical protein